MKYATELIDADRRLAETRLKDFVPENVYDLHIHPVNPAHYPPGLLKFLPDAVLGCAAHRAALQRYMPCRTIHGLFFGLPHPTVNRPALNEWIVDEIKSVGTPRSRALLLVSPDDDPAMVATALRSRAFAGIKVYHSFLRRENTMEAFLPEYAPEWIWEILHEVRGVLMLHLVRNDAIADPDNQRDLRRLCRAYPEARVVLAHIGRSFNYRHARAGLRSVADLQNVVVDTSAIAETDAYRVALDVLGPRRILWGSDYPISEARGRCVATGNKFYWIHPEWVRMNAIAEMTLVGIESLLCMREVCEDKGITQSDLEDMFHDNAFRLLNLEASV